MAALTSLYAAFLKAENRVGGGEGLVGIYGSMTQQGTSLMLASMAEHAGLCSKSVLVDIGCGLCRPLLHACVEHGVERTYGVELDAVKCQKAVPFVQHTVGMLAKDGFTILEAALPTVICMSIEQMGSLEPATHAYAAWEGFPETAKQAVGAIFQRTKSLTAITIVQRSMRNEDPEQVMSDLGFGEVECKAAALPVHMAGSRRKLNAYLFVKRGQTQSRASTAGLPSPAGPSLLTATPFDPAQVLSDLSRMTSNDTKAGAAATATGAAAGSPVSDRTSCRSDASQEQQQLGGGAGTILRHHDHGLRPRRSSVPSLGASSGKGGRSSAGSGSEPDLQGLVITSPGTKRSAGDAAPRAEDEDGPASQVSRAVGGPARAKAGAPGSRKPPVARALASTLQAVGSAPAPGAGSREAEDPSQDALRQPDQQAPLARSSSATDAPQGAAGAGKASSGTGARTRSRGATTTTTRGT